MTLREVLLKYQGNINGVVRFFQNGYNCFKQTFQTTLLKELVYSDYKSSDRLTFKRELEENLNQQINEYKHFEQILSKY